MRQAIQRALADPSLPPGHMRVLLAVLEVAASWSRMSEKITRPQIAERARVSEKTVTRAMKRLEALGVLRWLPSTTRGEPSVVALLSASAAETTGHPDVPPNTETTGHPDVPPYERSTEKEEDAGADEDSYSLEEAADDEAWVIGVRSVEMLGCPPETWGREPDDLRDKYFSTIRDALLMGDDPDDLWAALTSMKAPKSVECWPALMQSRLAEASGRLAARRSA